MLAGPAPDDFAALRARLERARKFGIVFSDAWSNALDASRLAPLDRDVAENTRETWARAYELKPPTPADRRAARFARMFDGA